MKSTFAGCALLCAMTAHAQATATPSREALEKTFVMHEAEWAAQECTHKIVETDLLWDDFMGTDTKGGRYSKQQSIDKSKADSTRARDCRLLETPQVHFYSDDVAVVFGSETAVEPKQGGGEERRCLYWTDTWLRRAGEWRIAAVQDARLPCPKGL
jgi:Domain of unknown function (DUF4440)